MPSLASALSFSTTSDRYCHKEFTRHISVFIRRAKMINALLLFVLLNVFLCQSLLLGYEIHSPILEVNSRRMSNQTLNEGNIDRRNNYCYVYKKVKLGNLGRREALNGLNVSIGVLSRFINKQTGKLDENDIAIKVFDEIAQRAKFNYKDSYWVVSPPKDNETFTDALGSYVDHYDVAVDWWIRSLDRVNRGISSSIEWYDSSTIMVARGKPASGVKMGAAFDPFNWKVWLLTVGTIVVTGFAYHVNDFIMHRRRREERDRLGTNIFKSYLAFTGNVTFEPKFLPNRLLLMSTSLLCLILVSAYTANLASFLVNENKQRPIEHFEDVIKYDYRVCVWRGVEDVVAIQFDYQDAKYVEKESELGLYQGLANGDCEVALVHKESHRIYENKIESNPTCDLKVVGFPVRIGRASFALRISVDLCSTILNEVLNMFLLEIIEDGTLNKIKEGVYQGSQDCTAEEKDEGDDQSLSLRDFSGIFIIHYSVIVVAFIYAVLHIMFPKYFKSHVDEISIVNRGSDFVKASVSGFVGDTEEQQLEEGVLKSNTQEKSRNVRLVNKLLKMNSEILQELKISRQSNQDLREEVIGIKKNIKEMQIFQWQNERSF